MMRILTFPFRFAWSIFKFIFKLLGYVATFFLGFFAASRICKRL